MKNPLFDIRFPKNPEALFGAVRKHDIHTGIDFYAKEDEWVGAIESGIVVAIHIFTGPRAESPWWEETYAVMIEGESGVICYGEIRPYPHIEIGMKVEENDSLGNVMRVLKKDKGLPMAMLHLELYKHGTRNPVVWPLGAPQPDCLLNVEELIASKLDYTPVPSPSSIVLKYAVRVIKSPKKVLYEDLFGLNADPPEEFGKRCLWADFEPSTLVDLLRNPNVPTNYKIHLIDHQVFEIDPRLQMNYLLRCLEEIERSEKGNFILDLATSSQELLEGMRLMRQFAEGLLEVSIEKMREYSQVIWEYAAKEDRKGYRVENQAQYNMNWGIYHALRMEIFYTLGKFESSAKHPPIYAREKEIEIAIRAFS